MAKVKNVPSKNSETASCSIATIKLPKNQQQQPRGREESFDDISDAEDDATQDAHLAEADRQTRIVQKAMDASGYFDSQAKESNDSNHEDESGDDEDQQGDAAENLIKEIERDEDGIGQSSKPLKRTLSISSSSSNDEDEIALAVKSIDDPSPSRGPPPVRSASGRKIASASKFVDPNDDLAAPIDLTERTFGTTKFLANPPVKRPTEHPVNKNATTEIQNLSLEEEPTINKCSSVEIQPKPKIKKLKATNTNNAKEWTSNQDLVLMAIHVGKGNSEKRGTRWKVTSEQFKKARVALLDPHTDDECEARFKDIYSVDPAKSDAHLPKHWPFMIKAIDLVLQNPQLFTNEEHKEINWLKSIKKKGVDIKRELLKKMENNTTEPTQQEQEIPTSSGTSDHIKLQSTMDQQQSTNSSIAVQVAKLIAQKQRLSKEKPSAAAAEAKQSGSKVKNPATAGAIQKKKPDTKPLLSKAMKQYVAQHMQSQQQGKSSHLARYLFYKYRGLEEFRELILDLQAQSPPCRQCGHAANP